MTSFSSLRSQIEALGLSVTENSITPAMLASLLDEMVNKIEAGDNSAAIERLSSALAALKPVPFTSVVTSAGGVMSPTPPDRLTILAALTAGSAGMYYDKTLKRFLLRLTTADSAKNYISWGEITDGDGNAVFPASSAYVAGKLYHCSEDNTVYTLAQGSTLRPLGSLGAVCEALHKDGALKPDIEVEADEEGVTIVFKAASPSGEVDAQAVIPAADEETAGLMLPSHLAAIATLESLWDELPVVPFAGFDSSLAAISQWPGELSALGKSLDVVFKGDRFCLRAQQSGSLSIPTYYDHWDQITLGGKVVARSSAHYSDSESKPRQGCLFLLAGETSDGNTLYAFDGAALRPANSFAAAIEQAKTALFDDMWLKLTGTEGSIDKSAAEGKHYICCGVGLTLSEAMSVVAEGALTNQNTQARYVNCKIRTALPAKIRYSVAEGIYTFYNSSVEAVSCAYMFPSTNCFAKCAHLREIKHIYSPNANGAGKNAGIYEECAELREIKDIRNVFPYDFSLGDSPLISYNTLALIVAKKSAATGSMVITLHADTYAKICGDTDNDAAAELTAQELAQWTSLPAAAGAKNITFALA